MSSPDVKLKLNGIELLSKTMIPRPENITGKEAFEFDIKIEAKVNAVEKIVLISTDINIREFKKELVLSSISVAYAFKIENFETVIIENKESKSFNIPQAVDVLLRLMAISTTRGIIFSEWQ